METRQQLEELQRQHTDLQFQHNEMKVKVDGMLSAQRLMDECLNELMYHFNTPVRFTPLNYGMNVQTIGTASPCLSPGALPSTGLDCSQHPSNFPSTSTSSGRSVSNMFTSTPARTLISAVIADRRPDPGFRRIEWVIS